MKKLFLLLVASFVMLNVMAEGHMKFKGVEIDGQLPVVVKQLEKQGFITTSAYKEYTILSGTFNGQDARVYVYESAKSRTVYQVVVVFAHSGAQWSTIWNDYIAYKERLQLKYGKPVESIEANRCSYSRDDPMFALRMDQAEYETMYKTDNGNIRLSIKKLPYPMDVHVCIAYIDGENWVLNEHEVLEDL